MVQDLWVKVQVGAEVWAEVVGKVEVEWVVRLPRYCRAFVYAPTVATKKGTE